MLRSMTGYGRGESAIHDRKFTTEIKSVNHRYFDINIKLPRTLNAFEDKIRKILSKEIFRGKIDVYISFETLSKDDIKLVLNEALADAYYQQLIKIKDRFKIETEEPTLELIAKFPDIINVEKNIPDEIVMEEIWESLSNSISIALGNFIEMRENEGESLKIDILNKVELISSLIEKVSTRSPYVLDEYRQKLNARLSEILAGMEIDENRILAESAIFADKSCVDEELTRLKSHLKQLISILEEKDSIGRKLDFLVQEMNREVNTIGSKSNDIEITRIIVDLKSEIEKIREQLQNIE